MHPSADRRSAPDHHALTVVTVSLATAAALADRPGVTALLLGGRVRGGALATVDHWAGRVLSGRVVDLPYVGVNGTSHEHGLTTSDLAVSEGVRRALRIS